MEKLKKPHDHTLTNILKVGIFSIFLMMPLMLFMPNVLYYGFNEHATDPEVTNVEINYKYQSNEVNTLNDLQINRIYHLDNFNINNVQSSTYIMNINFIKINEFDVDGDMNINDNNTYDYNNNNYNYVGFAIYETTIDFIFTNQNSYIDVYYDNCTYVNLTDVIFYITDNTWLGTFKEFCNNNNYLPEYTDYNIIEDVTTETTNSISSKMQLAWQETWQQPIFNWTDNNNFNFTINAFTNVFGITQESYITNYLTYILTLTAIYIVFDIIISVFTKLTHMLQ